MPVRIQDMDGVLHAVEVAATTLYEAVALGLAAIRRDEWVARVAQGLNVVKVSVVDVRVEHSGTTVYLLRRPSGRLPSSGMLY